MIFFLILIFVNSFILLAFIIAKEVKNTVNYLKENQPVNINGVMWKLETGYKNY